MAKPDNKYPILYSFRRCPYDMRARMCLFKAGIQVEIREVVLRDKPAQMLEADPKGSVPTILLPDGTGFADSLRLCLWALNQNDPDNWLKDKEQSLSLIETNDGDFKYALDRYKYPNRYPDEDYPEFQEHMRERGFEVLKDWNSRIEKDGFLNGPHITLADIATFPFVRQYAHTDRDWFYAQPIKPLINWLETHKESALFKAVMGKRQPWQEGDAPLIWPHP